MKGRIFGRGWVAKIRDGQVLLGGLALGGFVFGASPLPAQEPDPGAGQQEPAAAEIEEIVVLGAESESASDFEAADSVTGFGAEDLAALGAQDIADLAEFTPNLEIVTSGATTPTFFIRGVGLNDFNPNSTGAVAIYVDDVAINAPALQLGALYDVEAVNVLRGPQGTGLARNASAGAIKVYTRKPTGEFGGFLRSELGNYDFRDFEGAIEAPIWEEVLAGRFAFRFSERDGTMKNRCGNAPPLDERIGRPIGSPEIGPWQICDEFVQAGTFFEPGISQIPEGLPDRVNDIGNWAARGTFLIQPTLDMSWLLGVHGSRRDEWSRLGQSYGTNGFYCLDGDIENCFPGNRQWPDRGSRISGVLGGPQSDTGAGYWAPEVRAALIELAPCFANGTCNAVANRESADAAKQQVAKELAENLDSKPWAGDFNMCTDTEDGQDGRPDTPGTQCQKDYGRTTNDVWGGYLKGDVSLPGGIQLTSVTGYDTYDRLIDIDLDFSPDSLFQIRTDDEGWQVTQDLQVEGWLDEFPMRWDVGGGFLGEELDVSVTNDLGDITRFSIAFREYTQTLWSASGYASLAFDFWERFTLDGGFRYNWEQKKLDYAAVIPFAASTGQPALTTNLKDTWHAPTGTVRLTYRFREDTHVFWKYTRGWKPGTYNATSAIGRDFDTDQAFPDISVAEPETIDAFETGVRGSWLEGRLGVDLALFYYAYQDYQIFTAQQFADSPPQFVILNASDAEVYGAELDLVGRPWMGAFLNVRFGWLETQFLDFVQVQQDRVLLERPNGGRVQTVVNKELQNTGNPLLNSPRFKVSVTAEQMLPLGRWGSLTARYDGVWTDTTYFDATEGRGIPNFQNFQFLPEKTIAQAPYWLHNLRFSYRMPGGQVELAGWVRNLTNEAYKTFAFDGTTFSRTTIYFVGDPRTYGGTLMLTF